jgi:hypothetical protein
MDHSAGDNPGTHRSPIVAPMRTKAARVAVTPSPQGQIAAANVANPEFRVQKIGGGPGFRPGVPRSRTVLMACPSVSRRLPKCPPELKLPLLGVRPCPSGAAGCRESVTRRGPTSDVINAPHRSVAALGRPSNGPPVVPGPHVPASANPRTATAQASPRTTTSSNASSHGC